jgi:AraC family transcriptional regulator
VRHVLVEATIANSTGEAAMAEAAYASFAHWCRGSSEASYVRTRKSPGGILDFVEVARPSGVFHRPAMPNLILYQDLVGGSGVRGDAGWRRFSVTSEKGGFYLAAPDFANTVTVDASHRLRSLSFPVAYWQRILDEAAGGRFSMECLRLFRPSFHSPAIQSSFRKLWASADEEGVPSRLLAQAAGCEILAELCRSGGAPFTPARGGLALWAQHRCLELMRTRLSEDISLDELAAEVQLSAFHFSRMFKQSLGVPPRAYLTRLRLERACELLGSTDLPVTEIAHEVGYSSNQVLARVFLKHRHISPTDYRRVVRDPSGSIPQH